MSIIKYLPFAVLLIFAGGCSSQNKRAGPGVAIPAVYAPSAITQVNHDDEPGHDTALSSEDRPDLPAAPYHYAQEPVVLLAKKPKLERRDTIEPDGLPIIGKWMYSPSGKIANWLGAIYNGKNLHEPINIIIVDPYSTSPEEAGSHLLSALNKAGFPNRFGHSSGYIAYIDSTWVGQFQLQQRYSFADKVFEETNNHGRIFGPVKHDGKYWFVAAFSQESVNMLDKVKHRYSSFNAARDALAWALHEKTEYRIKAFLPLENTLLDDPAATSGDHDGIAVFLQALR